MMEGVERIGSVSILEMVFSKGKKELFAGNCRTAFDCVDTIIPAICREGSRGLDGKPHTDCPGFVVLDGIVPSGRAHPVCARICMADRVVWRGKPAGEMAPESNFCPLHPDVAVVFSPVANRGFDGPCHQ